MSDEIMKPYRIEGCPYLLLKLGSWADDVRVGSHLDVDGVTYKIIHSFHDCVGVELVKESR
tara:strand:- start:2104 stop:2286 length:183 start_codon:yes stop_codon:yes gene_type:complete